jgi:cytochrome c biogenesis protein CcdA
MRAVAAMIIGMIAGFAIGFGWRIYIFHGINMTTIDNKATWTLTILLALLGAMTGLHIFSIRKKTPRKEV